MSEENRKRGWDEGGGEERSDEWKVVRYVRRRYNDLAVASQQHSPVASRLVQPHLNLRWRGGCGGGRGGVTEEVC